MKYKRILLKLSGEALKNDKEGIVDFNYLNEICYEIKKCQDAGIQIGIVIGGGNIWRGRNNPGMDNVLAGHIGMLGTTINAMILGDSLRRVGADNKVLNSVSIDGFVEKFSKEKVLKAFSDNKVLIFGGGTGNPCFSTDSSAALRAIEIDADVIIKVTNVDGVYEEDPKVNTNAHMYDEISYQTILEKNLKVMDNTSIALCQNYRMPIIVMNINYIFELLNVINGKRIGTIVRN